jgi:dihydrofolate synthase/folylpolyglutamate synthase
MPELRDLFEAEESSAMWVAGEDYEIESNLLAVGGRTIDLRTPGDEYEQLFIPAHGAHQGTNVATGITAVEAFFGRPTPEELVAEAVAGIRLAGRFEVIGHEPTVILDGAHNPEGAAAAKATLDEEFARLGSWVLVVGLLTGKDPVEMLQALGADDFDAVICTEPNWSRAVPADEVAAAAAELGINAEVVRKPVEALERALAVTAADDLVLVAGSLYVVGDIRSAIPPE